MARFSALSSVGDNGKEGTGSLWADMGTLTRNILGDQNHGDPASSSTSWIRSRNRAMETLLKFHHDDDDGQAASNVALSPVCRLRGHAFDLRTSFGMEDTATKVEKAAEALEAACDGDELDRLEPVLTLLMRLGGSGHGDGGDHKGVQSSSTDDGIRHGYHPFLSVLKPDEPARLPPPPALPCLSPNSARIPTAFPMSEVPESTEVLPYRHFTRTDFEFPEMAVTHHPTLSSSCDAASSASKARTGGGPSYRALDRDVFLRPPGTGLGLLLPSFTDVDEAKRAEATAVVPTRKVTIPDLALTSDKDGRSLRIPAPSRERRQQAKTATPTTVTKADAAAPGKDEGYESPTKDSGGGDIWEQVLLVDLPQRRTWECLGRVHAAREKPYLTELGARGVHLAWEAAMRNLTLVDGTAMVPELRLIGEEEFVSHLGYLMVGIASESFPYDDSLESFFFKAGTCIRGVTTDTLEAFCGEFLTCGTYCRRLERLCENRARKERRPLGYTKPGLIYLGFLEGVSKYLQGYRMMVLDTVKRSQGRLLRASNSLAKLSEQIQFLGRLCRVNNAEKKRDDHGEYNGLPTGIQLLCYLFDRTLHINTRDLYFVLVSILRRTAEPYFKFLERWIFRGTHHDDFSEFGLHANPQCFGVRDRLYWTGAYVMADPSATSSFLNYDEGSAGGLGGAFLGEIQSQVYVCGKTVNLLRLCQPRHPLCAATVERQPTVGLLVSPLEQSKLKSKCSSYVAWMLSITDEKVTSLKKLKELEQEEKKELLKVAHKKHRETIVRLREEKKVAVEAEEKRKKAVLDDLRDQVEAERRRKEEERARKAEEDARYANLSKLKEAEEIAREESARREVEEHYRRLTEEAEKREERARWRLRRMELRESRLAFWRRENRRVQDHLRNDAHDLSAVSEESASPSPRKKAQSLLKWTTVRAEADEMGNAVLTAEDEEGNLVTTGAVAGMGEFVTAELQNQMLAKGFNSLPNWVKKRFMAKLEQSYVGSRATEEGTTSKSAKPPPSPSKKESSSKRKRPDSFVESDFKRVEVEKGATSPAGPPWQARSRSWSRSRSNLNLAMDASQSYESLASALDNRDAVEAVRRRRRPRELTTIDGRKRPASKSIEEVLYPARFSQHASSEPSTPVTPSKTQFRLLPELPVLPYRKTFDGLGGDEVESVAARVFKTKWFEEEEEADPEAFAPLSLLMENSVLIPLRAQLKVANSAMLNCLLVDHGLMEHFRALKKYLLFGDGEFAHQLCNSLFVKIREASGPLDVVNPSTLNRIVENATLGSTFASGDPRASNVGFVLQNPEEDDEDADGGEEGDVSAKLTLSNVFRYLRLSYRTSWPANIVLTEEAVSSYGRVFQFLLQLRKAVWGLEQVFLSLKEMRGYENSPDFRSVHLMRHEMLNFVTSTQDYVTSQVLDVSWNEFESELSDDEGVGKVHSVDTLREAHARYLRKTLFRCILNRKARAVHKIILDLFNIVAEFSLLLTSRPWLEAEDAGGRAVAVHPAMDKVRDCFKVFKDYSKFLYTVVKKLAVRGYQHHLCDLLLSLNFNEHYEKA